MMDYSKMSQEEFSDILAQVVFENASTLLGVPGVYEAASEHFHNEVLERWAEKQEVSDHEPADCLGGHGCGGRDCTCPCHFRS